MRLKRRNSLLLVYVKVVKLKYPIVVPLPLVAVEEILKAVAALAWVFTGGLKGTKFSILGKHQWGLLPSHWNKHVNSWPEPLQAMFPTSFEIQPWRIVSVVREFIAKVRRIGPFDLVDVRTDEARVLVKFV